MTITAAAVGWLQCHVKAGRTTDSCSRAGLNNNPIGSQTERITPPFFKNSSGFMLEKVEMNTTVLE